MKNLVDGHRIATGVGGPMEEMLNRHRRQLRDAFAEFIVAGSARDSILDLGAIGRSQAEDRLHAAGRKGVDHHVTFHDVLLPPHREDVADAASRNTDIAESVLQLPFATAEFDWVFCNRVLECAGDTIQQYMLLKEMARVARKGVFVTAANRRHPLEFNTGLPLLHWLPPARWQRCLAWMGKESQPSGLPLNLLDAPALSKMADLLSGCSKHDIGHIRYLGVKAHFFLMIDK